AARATRSTIFEAAPRSPQADHHFGDLEPVWPRKQAVPAIWCDPTPNNRRFRRFFGRPIALPRNRSTSVSQITSRLRPSVLDAADPMTSRGGGHDDDERERRQSGTACGQSRNATGG